MSDPNEPMRDLFRTVGHATPANDLTERIMARVAVTPVLSRRPVAPLVSRAGWAGIGGAAVLILIATAWAAPGMPSDGPLGHAFQALRAPLFQAGSWAPWLSGLSLCMLVLAAMDRLLVNRHRTI